MKTISLFIISSLMVSQAVAQLSISGRVLELSSGRKPVEGVNLSIMHVYEGVVPSDAGGNFEMIIQDPSQLSSVRMGAFKEGWKLIKAPEVRWLAAGETSSAKVTVIVAREEAIEKQKKEISTVLQGYIEDGYTQKNKTLPQGTSKTSPLKDPGKQRQYLQQQSAALTDRITYLNLDDLTAREKQALTLLKSGKLAESIRVMEDPKSAKEDAAFQQRNAALLAAAWLLSYDFDKAGAYYLKAARADSSDAGYVLNLAAFLKDQGQTDEAVAWYRTALDTRTSLAVSGEIYQELGHLYTLKKDYNTAADAYLQAAMAFQQVGMRTSKLETNEPFAASNFGSMALSMTKAIAAYDLAIATYEHLAAADPQKYSSDLCEVILTCLSLHHMDYSETRKDTIAALIKRAKEVIALNPSAERSAEQAATLKQQEDFFDSIPVFEKIYALMAEFASATAAAEKVRITRNFITEYTTLVQHGYPNMTVELGNQWGNLAWYLLFEKRFSEAEKAARESLKPTTFARTEGYDGQMAWVNTNLALSLLLQGRYKDAEKVYVQFKDEVYKDTGDRFKTPFLADLDDLEAAGITHPDMAKVRALLKK